MDFRPGLGDRSIIANAPKPGQRALQLTSLRIGTRGSPLALVQAEAARAAVVATGKLDPSSIQIVPIRTTGDRITDRPLTEAGGKGLFTKEIDEALIAGNIDIGVHSAKDLATRLPAGIVVAGCLPRADVRDVFISPIASEIANLPRGAAVGTSSLRRRALVLRSRPDLRVVDLRGNVETRLRKIEEGQAQATILAAAGMIRLGLGGRVGGFLDPDAWVPAPGQGAIAITARAENPEILAMVGAVDHQDTTMALAAERAFLAVLDGSCRTPIGGLARLRGAVLFFRGIIVKPDGSEAHEATAEGEATNAVEIGREVAAELARRGGRDFFASH
jgi:hydroxymethylbilane synthase